MCFIVQGQCKEMLFKSAYYELYNARLRIMDDDLPNAFFNFESMQRDYYIIDPILGCLGYNQTGGF